MTPRAQPRRRRRPVDALPLLALVVLAAGSWLFRDRLLAPWRGSDGASATGESAAGESADGTTPAANPHGVEPSASTDATSPTDVHGAGDASLSAAAGVAAQTEPTATSREVAEGAAAAASISPVPAPAAGPAPDDDELAVLVASWEAAPADEQALLRLVVARRARGQLDPALEEIVRFAEAGGSRDVAAEWIAQLDPFVDARRTLLLGHAARLIDEGSQAFRKDAWIDMAGLLDAAELLAGSVELGPVAALDIARRAPAARLASDDDLEPAAAVGLALAAARARLFESHDAVRALASYGALLPADVSTASRLRRLAAERRDEALGQRGESHELSSTHHVVSTRIGALLAEQVVVFLEELYDANRERFAHDPLGDEKLRVEIVTDADVFESRRTAAEPAPDSSARAFVEVRARRMVVLDPRATGASFDELWGLLAREATRLFVRPPSVGPFDMTNGSPWIEAAMTVDRMGARRLTDGRLVLDRLPADAWRLVRRAQPGGTGRRRPALTQVLGMPRHDRELEPWAWSLAWFLAEAVDANDEPRFAAGLASLLAAVRGGSGLSPVAEFQRWILATAPAGEDGERPSLASLEAEWARWLAEQAALDEGDDDALRAALARARVELAQRRLDEAAVLLRRVLTARPDDAEALSLRIELGRKQRRTDEALVAARHLAQCRAPSGDWKPAPAGERLPAEARVMSERIRWAEAVDLRRDAGERAADNDLALRVGVEALVDELLAAGFPLAAVRLVDTLLVTWPLDAGYRAMRAALLADVLHVDDVTLPRRLAWPEDVSAHGADPVLWWPEGNKLVVRCGDRVLPTTLRALARSVPPCRIELSVGFQADAEGRVHDDGTRFAGLLLGAQSEVDYGSWGLFVTPGGHVELATRGHLEWPSESIGRGARGGLDLAVELGGRHVEVFADGKSLGRLDRGERPTEGWLGLYVRHADVTFGELTLTARRLRDPEELWTLGLGR